MDYVKKLSAFDPESHLTSTDLREMEVAKGYGQLPSAVTKELSGLSGKKVEKHHHEKRMLLQFMEDLKEQNGANPPYGFVLPTSDVSDLLLPEPKRITTEPYERRDADAFLQMTTLRGLNAVADLKCQSLFNSILCDAADDGSFAQERLAGDAVVKSINPDANWKLAAQSALSNAKRSEFILIKQIIRQCLRELDRVPSREEFLEVAIESQKVLEMLATTHQAVFRAINSRIIQDAANGTAHRLVRNSHDKGQIALLKRSFVSLNVDRGDPRVRTMCAALLVKDEEGVSLLEHSYRDSVNMVDGMLYECGAPSRERLEAISSEQLLNPSIHTYLKLRLARA